MVGCGLACPGARGLGLGGGSWGTHTIWGGGGSNTEHGTICTYTRKKIEYTCRSQGAAAAKTDTSEFSFAPFFCRSLSAECPSEGCRQAAQAVMALKEAHGGVWKRGQAPGSVNLGWQTGPQRATWVSQVWDFL